MSLGEGSISLNLAKEDWYVYSDEYGTDEEKYLVKFIYTIKDKLLKTFNEVYLIRNQKILPIKIHFLDFLKTSQRPEFPPSS
mgnify:CR=1 FL=1